MSALLAVIEQHLDFAQQRLILVCCCVVITAAGTSYLLLPAYRAYQASATENAALKQQLEVSGIPDSELTKLQHQIQTIQQELTTNRVGHSPRQAEADLLSKLHASTKTQNLTLLKVTPQKASVESGVRRLTFDLEVVGSYQNTANWLVWLETQAGTTRLQQFEIGARESGGYKPSHQLHTKVAVTAFLWENG